MATLFSPITLRNTVIKNRIFASPMCQYSATDGLPNHWHLVHYGGLATGGAGLVMVEATAVVPQGRITPHCTGLWSDAHTQAFKPIVDFIKQQGAVPAIQLAHAGRKASCDVPWRDSVCLPLAQGGWQPVAPSALAFSPQHTTPAELNLDGIATLKQAFVAAAQRALNAGFEVIELHCAHGYLLHEFLSPLSNQRTDHYGGNLENRCRIVLEIAQLLRDFLPQDNPMLVRISATDWVEHGWDLAQSLQLALWLKTIGIDLIDCSSGGLVPEAKIPNHAGYQTQFSAKIREHANIATGAVGLITQAMQAEHIIATEQADVVFLARALLSDPRWPLHAAKILHADIAWPNQYVRAKNNV